MPCLGFYTTAQGSTFFSAVQFASSAVNSVATAMFSVAKRWMTYSDPAAQGVVTVSLAER